MQDLTRSEIQIIKEENRSICFSSSLKFLQSHNGLRRSKVHILLGRKGAGKSTLVRSVNYDFLAMNEDKKILIYLSEETIEEYYSGLPNSLLDRKNRMFVMSELSNKEINSDITQKEVENKIFLDVKNTVDKIKPDFVVIDNLTTSRLYADRNSLSQFNVMLRIKNMAIYYNIPVLCIMHTKKQISENHEYLIDDSDCRGSDAAANLSEFFYIMQTFMIGNERMPTLRITKHRGQKIGDKMFFLNYSEYDNIYSSDKPVNFIKFKELFSQRNKL